MNEEDKKRIDIVIDSLGIICDALDKSLDIMSSIAKDLPIEEQKRIKAGIGLVLDHLQGSITEAKVSLKPIEDNSKEYMR